MNEDELIIAPQDIINALKYGVKIKKEDGSWEKLTGVTSLTYLEQFDMFIIVAAPKNNPSNAKPLFLNRFKIEWDVNDEIGEKENG